MRCSRTGAAAQTRPRVQGLRQRAAVAEYGSPPSSLRSSAPHTGNPAHLASHRARRLALAGIANANADADAKAKTTGVVGMDGVRGVYPHEPPRRCAASRDVFAVCGAEERSVLGSEPYLGDFPALSEACTQAEFAGKPPQYVSTAGDPLYPRGTASGSPFLCLLSFGEAKESEAAAGTQSRLAARRANGRISRPAEQQTARTPSRPAAKPDINPLMPVPPASAADSRYRCAARSPAPRSSSGSPSRHSSSAATSNLWSATRPGSRPY